MTTTTNLHAHIATASSDCDGPMYRDYVTTMNAAEQADQFGDLAFKERVMGNHVSFSPLDKVQVEVTSEGFTMHDVTDEGYRSAEVRWCEDECADGEYSQRDVYAEMMGY